MLCGLYRKIDRRDKNSGGVGIAVELSIALCRRRKPDTRLCWFSSQCHNWSRARIARC